MSDRLLDASGSHGFVYNSTDGTFTPLNVPGATRTSAYSINDSGQVTGDYREIAFGPSRGFVYSGDGTFTTFGPQGARYTYAYSINASGQVAGSYVPYVDPGRSHGFVYNSTDGTFAPLDVPGDTRTDIPHPLTAKSGIMLE